ncbi:hypothetical protein CsSME_00021931 [Camellia sinensis var. sinensis]|uniref:hydroxyproline O-galactosyltransferase GALT6-like isoform X2 n=1 Tax=Camellia sinensis TaxID=4442 RepID=UPI001035CE9E|nr:hydroxyproline O-galactosyltransferase GALT6-like isoform X2 [Camellia sinensis]
MKRAKIETLVSLSRLRSIQILTGVLFFYLLLMSFEIPLVLKTQLGLGFGSGEAEDKLARKESPNVESFRVSQRSFVRTPERRMREEHKQVSGLVFDVGSFGNHSQNDFSELHKMANHAFMVGKKLWEEISSGKIRLELENRGENLSESCTHSISISGDEFKQRGRIMVIPCGLTLGSHITVVGKPNWAHPETEPKIALVREKNEIVMVSQFMMELQGLKTVDGEEPPRILHFNPRLKGDFSGRPVIEQNTCYRMQWGSALRCEGWRSNAGEETVDGQVKCEKWIRDDDNRSEESKTIWWLNRLIGRTMKVTVDWPYPFAEDKLFVLTLRAGLEGYHISVDGRHITSFPYRTGFTLDDATGLFVKGDLDVHSIFAASLPTSHPSFAPQMHLEMFSIWKSPPLPDAPVELFIGILSAGNHFAERMAVRKSWMQHPFIKSLNVVARFFVALHGRQEINAELMKETEFFRDIVIVPYMDNYDLVVLKTVAICEYGVRRVAANYIMKCDDDTFVRIDAVIEEAKKVHGGRSLYVGNINYYHKPLRNGKWAVTYELFKMEDVSMGMWVEKFNSSRLVEYLHSMKFCQFGCVEDYYTAHYQSPRQMMCLWDKLQSLGEAQCCNMR